MDVLITFKRRSGRHDSSGTHGHSMMMMMSITISATDQSSKGRRKISEEVWFFFFLLLGLKCGRRLSRVFLQDFASPFPEVNARGEGATLRQGQGACGWAEFHTVCDCGRGRGHSLPRLSGSLRFPGAFQRCHDFARCTRSSFRGGYAHLPCMLCCLSLP